MEVSGGDSIKLGRGVSVGEMSGCGIIGCLSCRGKQPTLSLLSSSGRSLLLLSLDLFLQLLVVRVSMADARSVFRQRTVEKGAGAGGAMACHGGLGGIGIENTMIVGVSDLEAT